MKRILSILLPAVLLLAACEREKAEVAGGQKLPAVKEYVSFHTGDTKTTVDGTGNLGWVAGDEIIITYKGNTYNYTADNSGASTSFSPKTEADKIPVASDHIYTLEAAYGDSFPLTQTIAADGSNSSKLPLLASVEEILAENDEINLHFVHKASLLRLAFSEEDIAFKSIRLSGLDEGSDMTLDFPDGLDLSKGPVTVQVIVGTIISDADEGLLMDAVCADDSRIARVMWVGSARKLAVGTLIDQPVSQWRSSPAGISTAKELKEFAILVNKGCPATRFTSDGTPGGKVQLLADVDISKFAPWVPIGNNGSLDPGEAVTEDKILKNEFDGGGHSVSGLTIEQAHERFSNYGLFGVAAADIHDLKVEGSILLGSGEAQNLNLCVGGVASTLRPGCNIAHCTSNVNINVQYYGTKALSGSDVYNANSSTVHKWQRVGGIAGRCSGNISDCENKGDIKFTNGTSAKTIVVNCHYGGIAGQVCEYSSNDVSIIGCNNSGNIASQGRIGGYSDKPGGTADISSVYQVFQGMSLGGIVGTLGHMVTADMPAQGGTAYMSGCTNNGEIGNNFNCAGGNFGGVAGRTGCDSNIIIADCTNTKSVYGAKSSGESQQSTNNDFFFTMGGVVGVCHSRGGELSGLTNSGNVYVNNSNTAAVVGGVLGIISTFSSGVGFSNLSNSGGVYTSKESANTYINIGGIAGRVWTQGGSKTIVLDSPVNTGYIRNSTGGQRARVGGLVGYTNGFLIINDGVNKGNTTAWTKSGSSGYSNVSFVGGLIGEVGNNFPTRFNRCKQYGYVSYNNTSSYHGLVVGCYYQNSLTAVGCHASGTFGLSGGTTYTIASDSDLSSMVTGGSTDTSISEGKINILCFYDSSCAMSTPWEWSYHEID